MEMGESHFRSREDLKLTLKPPLIMLNMDYLKMITVNVLFKLLVQSAIELYCYGERFIRIYLEYANSHPSNYYLLQ